MHSGSAGGLEGGGRRCALPSQLTQLTIGGNFQLAEYCHGHNQHWDPPLSSGPTPALIVVFTIPTGPNESWGARALPSPSPQS